jgi:prepilin signal peptidase PulO-like enzyme (type II secretory pathway)
MMVYMEQITIYIVLVILGLSLGSFSGAIMWRLRARQLARDKKNGEKVDNDEYDSLKKLTKKSLLSVDDHSVCLHCSYRLKWYDLIPLLSWLLTRGKCRKCHKPIGYLEPLIELGMVAYFVLSYAFWPYPLTDWLEIARLVLWLAAGVPLAILFAYDIKWLLMDEKTNYTLIGIGVVSAVLVVLNSPDKVSALYSLLGSVLILSGLYFAVYFVSKGRWIGFADPVLGLGLGLLLADWRLAFLALFAANLIGCIMVIPGLITKKQKMNSHVPFGPLLIAGFVIAGLAGNYLINLYLNYFL